MILHTMIYSKIVYWPMIGANAVYPIWNEKHQGRLAILTIQKQNYIGGVRAPWAPKPRRLKSKLFCTYNPL
jgi:hypothetical protein